MMPPSNSPILVTGAHRSGTTFTGEILALARGVGYIYEPFNLRQRPAVSSARFEHWFEYVTEDSADRYAPALRRTLEFSYDMRSALRSVRLPRHVVRAAQLRTQWDAHRRAGDRPLMKDPIAVFSAEWLHRTFAMDVVVLVRHPAAMASSIKRLRWRHDFRTFLRQPKLLALFPEYESEIRDFVKTPRTAVEQAALLWKLIYHVVDMQRSRFPDWSFIRHEDLARDPVPGFAELYGRLGLEFTPSVAEKIEQMTSAKNRSLSGSGYRVAEIDSRQSVRKWRSALEPAEIAAVREITQPVADRFYSPDADW